MDIGVLTVPLGGESIDDAVAYLDDIGVDAVELGVGGWPARTTSTARRYSTTTRRRRSFGSYSTNTASGSPRSRPTTTPSTPTRRRAAAADRELREAIELADQLDVGTVTCFSGLPAGAPGDSTPNWITAPWPSEHADAHEYQWDEVAIPYWTDLAKHADHHGVDVAIEMHPNMLVYEPTGMLALREATNEADRRQLRPLAPLLAGDRRDRGDPIFGRPRRDPPLPRGRTPRCTTRTRA